MGGTEYENLLLNNECSRGIIVANERKKPAPNNQKLLYRKIKLSDSKDSHKKQEDFPIGNNVLLVDFGETGSETEAIRQTLE